MRALYASALVFTLSTPWRESGTPGAIPPSIEEANQGPTPGEAAGPWPCAQSDVPVNPSGICIGFPPSAFSSSSGRALGDWLINWDLVGRPWGIPKKKDRRTTQPPTKKSLQIQSIMFPETYALQSLTSRGLVVARLQGNANDTWISERYNIGGRNTAGLRNAYYFVVDTFYVGSPSGPGDSYDIGHWTLYGIVEGTNVLRRVNEGRLHFCKPPYTHKGSISARFSGCADAHFLADLESRKAIAPTLKGRALSDLSAVELNGLSSLTRSELNRLRKILGDEEIAPGWIMCGTGCCTLGF